MVLWWTCMPAWVVRAGAGGVRRRRGDARRRRSGRRRRPGGERPTVRRRAGRAAQRGVGCDLVRFGAIAADATVIVDPPRTGLSKEVLGALVHAAPPRLVYVSCDPATLARDCRGLSDNGYELAAMTLFDMFPNTAHVEAVAILRRRREKGNVGRSSWSRRPARGRIGHIMALMSEPSNRPSNPRTLEP
jgi:hypothetical protein